jgi:hypothetical protein
MRGHGTMASQPRRGAWEEAALPHGISDCSLQSLLLKGQAVGRSAALGTECGYVGTSPRAQLLLHPATAPERTGGHQGQHSHTWQGRHKPVRHKAWPLGRPDCGWGSASRRERGGTGVTCRCRLFIHSCQPPLCGPRVPDSLALLGSSWSSVLPQPPGPDSTLERCQTSASEASRSWGHVTAQLPESLATHHHAAYRECAPLCR